MKSSALSIIIAVIVIAVLAVGGYFLVKKFTASASVENAKVDADLNGDGKVNVLDLNILNGAISNKKTDKKYDLNRDSKVDKNDVTVLIEEWKKGK